MSLEAFGDSIGVVEACAVLGRFGRRLGIMTAIARSVGGFWECLASDAGALLVFCDMLGPIAEGFFVRFIEGSGDRFVLLSAGDVACGTTTAIAFEASGTGGSDSVVGAGSAFEAFCGRMVASLGASKGSEASCGSTSGGGIAAPCISASYS